MIITDAIVFTSESGHTEEYAKMFGEATGLPVMRLKEACKALPRGSEIIFFGWLAAGIIKGYKKANGKFAVRAAVAVGMARGESQFEEVKKNNKTESLPLFVLQGGLAISKLHGIYRFMMKIMQKTAGKGVAEKTDRTEEESELFEMMTSEKSYVNKENLAPVLEWYGKINS